MDSVLLSIWLFIVGRERFNAASLAFLSFLFWKKKQRIDVKRIGNGTELFFFLVSLRGMKKKSKIQIERNLSPEKEIKEVEDDEKREKRGARFSETMQVNDEA
jgi:hypothetical protein